MMTDVDKAQLMMLYTTYMEMTGDKPVIPWEQWVYDTLVQKLIEHAPALLENTPGPVDDSAECYAECDDPMCHLTHDR